MKKITFIIFMLFNYLCWSQGNIVSISSPAPVQFTICGTPKVFTISIYNPSPFLLSSDTLKLSMPTGVIYQLGSVTTATELYTSIPHQPVFLLPDIPTLSTLTVTFSATAGCGVIPYTSGGGAIENIIRVNYTANNIKNYDTYTSPYTIRQPNLSITTVTNQSYSGSLGNIFNRCITIVNTGQGQLNEVIFTDIHGNGIQISAVNTGTWISAGSTETVTLNASHFNTIGNNNGLFEQGESITICETLQIINCSAVSSDFKASWGCNSQVCQSAISSANVVFPNLIPNLEITSLSAPMNNCLGAGNPSPQILRIVNTGLGQATNIQLDIYQTNGTGYNPFLGSNIDETSFTIQTGSNAPVTITPDSTENTDPVNCMAPNVKGRVYITLSSVNAGDTVYVRFNTYSCCFNSCTQTGQSYFNGWAYKGSYSNACQSPYLIYEAWGRVHSQLFASLENSIYTPSYLDSGQTAPFIFNFTSFIFQTPYPASTSAHWKFVFTLPPCLDYSGNLNISGAGTWNPDSVNVSGNIVTAIFNGQPPFTLDQAKVMVDLSVNCNGCSGLPGTVDITAFYVPDTSCSCEVTVACQNAPITVFCIEPIIYPPEPPVGTCAEGMMFRYYYFDRSSYGLPDNETGGGNGLPDGGGSLDFSKIKINRAMFGDTITNSYNGKVRTSLAHPSWQYCYVSASITDGNLLSYLDAQLSIYRGGLLFASCTGFIPLVITTGSTRSFSYDLSVAGLISSGCLPSGFVYSNSDSVVFKPRYQVTTNTTGPVILIEATNEFYVSDVPNPAVYTDRYQCDGFVGRCFIIGYRLISTDDSYHIVRSCDNFIASQNYGLSIGPCCNNYDGGNLFPFEYRNWAHISILQAIVPPGYNFVSAQFVEKRTAGTGVSVASPAVSLIPVDANSDTLTFPVENFLQGYGGTMPLSDDGFFGTLEVTLVPSCEVTPLLSQGIKNNWTYEPTVYLTGAGSYPTYISVTQDYVIYEAPDLLLQAILPSVSAAGNIASWEITISNTSNVSHAMNTWLSTPAISGVSVIQVVDLDSTIIIPPTGAFYQVGVINATDVRKFRIDASFTSCTKDSIIIYSGWNCAGYPDSLASYPCIPQKITLTETPLLPELDMNVTVATGSVQLCDTSTYSLEGINIQPGTLYDVTLSAALPAGLSIVAGTSMLSYPHNSAFTAISNPVFINGTVWEWNLSAINNLIGSNGLIGVPDTNLNSFTISFEVVTDCNYMSGSVIQFKLKGSSSCGLEVMKGISSPQLFITGATTPYNADVSLQTSYLSPCAANSVMKVSIINEGLLATGLTDSIAVLLPFGVSFVNNSFSGIHNPPVNANPNQLTWNNQVRLMWKIPPGIQPGDSIVFTFNYAGAAADLSCGISYFHATTLSTANVVCTSTGNACEISVLTGQDTLPVFIYMAYLSLSNPYGYAVPNPPLGETASVSFTINNIGQDIFPANNTIISYYYDSDGNGFYNQGDVFIVNDTQQVSIPENGSYLYSANINIPSGNSCSIIALLDTAISPCSCVPSQLAINLPMKNSGTDTFLCSGQSIPLGFPSVNGYTYLWDPSTGLSDPVSSAPLFTGVNNTGLPLTHTFVITTDRINCISKDTITLIVNPVPVFSISGTDTICYGESDGNAMVISLINGTPPYSYLWNTVPVQINDTATNLPAGNYSAIVSDTNGCSSMQLFDIFQPNSQLSASIASSTNITCNALCNGSATVTAIGGTGNYTYSWNTTPEQTTAAISGICAGNYTVSVNDNDTSGCSTSATLIITEPPLLTTSVSVFNSNCNGGNDATATVTASGGTAGYSYLWSNGQTSATATGLSPGTYTITVTDTNFCVQTTTAIISPAVEITATPIAANICAGQSTTINALASGGTPNYSYLWNTSDTTQSLLVLPSVPTSYTVTVTDNSGCKDSAVIQINVYQNPVVNFTATALAGCSPLCLSFQDASSAGTGNNVQWLWNLGDGGAVSNSQTFDHCYYNDSAYSLVSYTVSLTVTSDNGCSTAFSKNDFITVYPNPDAAFAVEPETLTIAAPLISITNLSAGADFWNWNFGDTDTSGLFNPSFHTYTDTGTYLVSLMVSNQYGCLDSAYQTIVIEPDFLFYIPNSFTPNDNGKNDTFSGKGVYIKKYEMMIFDRWGNLIFHTDDINKGWDGTANYGTEIAQMDVYVYQIKAFDYKDKKHTFRGIVTLVR